MIEQTTSIGLGDVNVDDMVTNGKNANDADTVWGMPQFKENYGENLTEHEYLETVRDIC